MILLTKVPPQRASSVSKSTVKDNDEGKEGVNTLDTSDSGNGHSNSDKFQCCESLLSACLQFIDKNAKDILGNNFGTSILICAKHPLLQRAKAGARQISAWSDWCCVGHPYISSPSCRSTSPCGPGPRGRVPGISWSRLRTISDVWPRGVSI